MIRYDLPLYLKGSQNAREHWGAKARRVKTERTLTATLTAQATRQGCPMPCTITLTRHGSGKRMDGDNLQACFKGVRDGIAECLGVDDNDPRIEWRYAQESCKRGDERATVTIEGET